MAVRADCHGIGQVGRIIESGSSVGAPAAQQIGPDRLHAAEHRLPGQRRQEPGRGGSGRRQGEGLVEGGGQAGGERRQVLGPGSSTPSRRGGTTRSTADPGAAPARRPPRAGRWPPAGSRRRRLDQHQGQALVERGQHKNGAAAHQRRPARCLVQPSVERHPRGHPSHAPAQLVGLRAVTAAGHVQAQPGTRSARASTASSSQGRPLARRQLAGVEQLVRRPAAAGRSGRGTAPRGIRRPPARRARARAPGGRRRVRVLLVQDQEAIKRAHPPITASARCGQSSICRRPVPWQWLPPAYQGPGPSAAS